MRQKVGNWVISPLGINLLLALKGSISENIEKYVLINSLLKENKCCSIKNKIYYAQTISKEDVIRNPNKNVDYEAIPIKDTMTILENDGCGSSKTTSQRASFLYTNVSEFEVKWRNQPDDCSMKVYNSFNYTQDIKYEARVSNVARLDLKRSNANKMQANDCADDSLTVLELPMQEDNLKLIILLPNEQDVLEKLFSTLSKDGFTAAINSIQPLFTVQSELKAPNVHIPSENRVPLQEYFNESLENEIEKWHQRGSVCIDSNGVNIKVFTSFSSHNNQQNEYQELRTETPFYFALTYNDTALFAGKYSQNKTSS